MITLSLKDSRKIRMLIAMDGNDLKGFSEQADISYSYFISILSGKYNPSVRTANKIASTLGEEMTDLFDIESSDKEKVT
ncbi:hypothetical protein GCM10008935_07830 [Alkalibacillus silvisoli]|uniref:HTH cro/C1-type domain-containing protein n=2 Tax=Alkalibacillus silvisoli TaxID=392823 RepID=A0ABN0ZQ87_9BACI